jgi:altronate dehydratase
MRKQAIVLHARDNVASSLVDLEAGEQVQADIPEHGALSILLAQPIPIGHKFALTDIPRGAEVIKYGVPIGSATQDIVQGEHVHTHNLV